MHCEDSGQHQDLFPCHLLEGGDGSYLNFDQSARELWLLAFVDHPTSISAHEHQQLHLHPSGQNRRNTGRMNPPCSLSKKESQSHHDQRRRRKVPHRSCIRILSNPPCSKVALAAGVAGSLSHMDHLEC